MTYRGGGLRKASTLLEKLWIDKKTFVSAEELGAYCAKLGWDHASLIHYMIKMRYILRVFKGMFYVRSSSELRKRACRYNHLELAARGLGMKGVDRWYFGLHTALKINNMTHEFFTLDDVISDSFRRSKVIRINGNRFKFTRVSPRLFGFGIVQKGVMRYSDPEKTILDFIYLARQDGVHPVKAAMDVADWSESVSATKMLKYAKRYPATIQKIAGDVINDR